VSIQVNAKVIWRGTVYEVAELGTRFGERWLRLIPYGMFERWVPAKHVRLGGAGAAQGGRQE
jgi:hypothetical protein